jgi:hypothetical protein
MVESRKVIGAPGTYPSHNARGSHQRARRRHRESDIGHRGSLDSHTTVPPIADTNRHTYPDTHMTVPSIAHRHYLHSIVATVIILSFVIASGYLAISQLRSRYRNPSDDNS